MISNIKIKLKLLALDVIQKQTKWHKLKLILMNI